MAGNLQPPEETSSVIVGICGGAGRSGGTWTVVRMVAMRGSLTVRLGLVAVTCVGATGEGTEIAGNDMRDETGPSKACVETVGAVGGASPC